MKRNNIAWALAVVLLLTLFPLSPVQAATTSVTINSTNFPDAKFRTIVKEFDTNGDGKLSATEIADVTSLLIDNRGISSLKGVQYFTNLQDLYCTDNSLKTLDISKNTNLLNLFCSGNQISSLDVTKNTKLMYIACHGNALKTLNVSYNTRLESLECDDNQLTSLDVTKLTKLKCLSCDSNRLTALNTVKNTKLTYLNCSFNNIAKLNILNNPDLQYLYCHYDPVAVLDLTENTELTDVGCAGCRLKTLDVSRNTKLVNLDCYYNELTSLNLMKNTALRSLECSGNKLKTLNISYCTKLTADHIDADDDTVIVSVKKAAGVKAVPVSKTSVKLTWSKSGGASGYMIYRCETKNGTYKAVRNISSASTVSCTVGDQTAGKTYYYRVRAYRIVDGTRIYGPWSSVVWAPPYASGLKVASTTKTSVKLAWTKSTGADGYMLYRSTSKGGTYSAFTSITSPSTLTFTNTKLKTGQTYYYKVRAYKLAGEVKVYGNWSSVVSATPK